MGGYATSTVQANVAVVQVPDARLQPLADIFNPKKVTPTTVEFVDVAGMGQAAQAGKEKQGLSAKFLGHIRNADALAIVLRTFANDNVPHIYNSIDPTRDLDGLKAKSMSCRMEISPIFALMLVNDTTSPNIWRTCQRNMRLFVLLD